MIDSWTPEQREALRNFAAAEAMRERREERWRIIKGIFWACVITALSSWAVLKILGLL